jgi:hypothetical protein
VPHPYDGPPSAPYPYPTMERRSTGALVAGSILLPVGLTMALADSAFFQHGPQTCAFDGSAFECSTSGGGAGVVAILVAGLVAAVVGVPLIIYGAKRVPAADGVGVTGALPRWAGAPAGNGWRWTF